MAHWLPGIRMWSLDLLTEHTVLHHDPQQGPASCVKSATFPVEEMNTISPWPTPAWTKSIWTPLGNYVFIVARHAYKHVGGIQTRQNGLACWIFFHFEFSTLQADKFNIHQMTWYFFVPDTLPSPYQYKYPAWYFSQLRSKVFSNCSLNFA